jgi:amino acid transporter
MSALRVVFLILATITTLLCVWFVVRYQAKTNGDWRYSETGRHLMSMAVSIGAVCGVWSVGIALALLGSTDLPLWFHVLRVLVFLSIPAMLAWRVSILERAYREPVEQDAEGDEDARA